MYNRKIQSDMTDATTSASESVDYVIRPMFITVTTTIIFTTITILKSLIKKSKCKY